jgi:hypothetical protein
MAGIGQSAGNRASGILRDYTPGIQSKEAEMDLSAEWVVGFVDGEGCFYVGINRHPEMSVGYQVLPEFRVVQHERDVQVLYALKRFFRAGVVRRNHADRFELRIRKLAALTSVVAFFEQHPLKTKKQQDFLKFRDIVRLMKQGEHLHSEGLQQIITIALEMNREDKPKAAAILAELKAATG